MGRQVFTMKPVISRAQLPSILGQEFTYWGTHAPLQGQRVVVDDVFVDHGRALCVLSVNGRRVLVGARVEDLT